MFQESSSPRNSSLSVEAQARIAEQILIFSKALKSGGNPAIESYLDDFQAEERTELLRELLLIEIEHRGQSGELVSFQEYRERFPEEPEVLTEAESQFRNEKTRLVPDREPPEPGEKLHYVGDYELLEEIGRGGMGVVYRARQMSLDRVVAVKMLLHHQIATDSDIARFEREAKLAATLEHSNIVAVHEVDRHNGDPYFSMAYVNGQSLAEMVREHPLPPKDAARYVHVAAAAVDEAHKLKILHRDLKPSNILIDQNNQVRITDFGLAKQLGSDETLTETGGILGTASYMSPEQAAGNQAKIGVPSDVYSLGAVLYELLTGRPPFAAATVLETLHQVKTQEVVSPRVLNRNVPKDLETICVKCLEKEPKNRFYGSAAELAEDLNNYLEGKSIKARRTTRLEKSWRWLKRNPALGSMSGALALGLVVSLILILIAWDIIESFQPKPVPPSPNSAIASYKGEPGQHFSYRVSIRQVGSDSPEFDEIFEYEVVPVPDNLLFHQLEKQNRRGTGFLVNSEGHLVTCAHIVEDAVKITVVIDEQAYPGTVVAFDRTRDLAILKIHANDLPSIPLADSTVVKTTSGVRTIGYPTSSDLQPPIEIQHATVSSIDRRENDRPFSIDEQFEESWSGGPIIADRERVVGLVSKRLTDRSGSASSSVVIPSNSLRSFLKDAGVPFDEGDNRKDDFTVRDISAATALIQVVTGPNGVGSSERFAVRYDMNWESPTQKTIVAIDPLGNVVDTRGQPTLPHFLGGILNLVLPPLPCSGLTRWKQTHNEEFIIERGNEIVPDHPLVNMGFPVVPGVRQRVPGLGNPLDPRVQAFQNFQILRRELHALARYRPATREITYEIKNCTANQMRILRTEVLASEAKVPEGPVIQLTSSGHIVFDLQRGVVTELETKAFLRNRTQGTLRDTQWTIDIDLIRHDE